MTELILTKKGGICLFRSDDAKKIPFCFYTEKGNYVNMIEVSNTKG